MAKIILKWERETKGTHVYKNDAEDAPIPSLYIKKTAFKDPAKAPKSISFEISELK